MPQNSQLPQDSRAQAFALIAILTAVAVSPMFLLGYHRGHDLEIHLQSWMDAAAQFRQGILYPRWASEANYGFGEPRFIFYPPASWMLGGVLGLLLPWRIVPAVFIWLTMIFAALAMRKLAADWLPSRSALVAGLLYALNPYLMLTAYTRCAFGELLASAIFPVLLWGALRIERDTRSAVTITAISVAAIWLTNLPAGVIASYSLTCVLMVIAILHRSPRPLLYGFAATLTGIGLAAFSVLPAAWEQKWVNIKAAATAIYLPELNFLFSSVGAPNAHEFNHRLSLLALPIFLAAVASAIATRQLRKRVPIMWWSLTVLCAVSGLLTFRVSLPLWRVLPELHFLQFPWRWLFPFCAATALLVAFAVSNSKRKPILWAAIAFVLILLDGSIARTKTWFPRFTDKISQAFQSGAGYAGLLEYAPLAQRGPLPLNAPDISIADPAAQDLNAIGVEAWSPEDKVILADLARPTLVNVKLLAYPAWHATVNGKSVALQVNPETGQVMLPLPSGSSRTEIRFAQTPDRFVGIVISAVSGTILAVFWGAFARSRKPSREPRADPLAAAQVA